MRKTLVYEVKEIAENDRITIFLYKRGIPEV